MRMFLISNNMDTKTGMRLAGISGVIANNREETMAAMQKAIEDPEVGIILITEKLVELIRKDIQEIKMSCQTPLIVEIPDRHSVHTGNNSITRYVRDAIGLKI